MKLLAWISMLLMSVSVVHAADTPGVTNSDVGYSPDAIKTNPSLPFIFSSGAGGSELGYMITVPHH